MERELDQENPTAGDSGASITDRIGSYLAAQDAPQQTTEPSPQGKEPDAATGEPGDEGDQGQAQEPQQIALSDVAKWLGVEESALDVDQDGSIKVKTKIDGKEGAAKFADMLKDYQIRGHAENKAREVAERERAVETRRQEVEQQAQARLQQVEQLGNVAAAQLMREYQSIDWNALRQSDPGHYAALRADFQERNAQLQSVFQHAQQEAMQRQQQAARAQQEVVQKQTQRLPEIIPEWKDEATANKERGEIRTWATKAGFEPSEIDGFTMAHHVAVMRKAMLYDRLQESKAAVEKQVRLAPTLAKPGSAQPQSKEAKLSDLRTQIRKTGGKQGVADYLKAKGIV